MTELLKDASNKPSSKRIAGFVGLGLIAFTAVYGVIAGTSVVGVIWPLITFTGACFGLTVLEKK